MKKQIKKIFRVPIEISNDYYMESFSGNELVLSGFGEIKKLEESIIEIEFGAQIIIFYGNSLNISNYTGDGVKISGKVNKIEFIKKE